MLWSVLCLRSRRLNCKAPYVNMRKLCDVSLDGNQLPVLHVIYRQPTVLANLELEIFGGAKSLVWLNGEVLSKYSCD